MSEEEQNENPIIIQEENTQEQIILEKVEDERPTEMNNDEARYTEVENDYLSNPIEGLASNNNNIIEKQNDNEEIKIIEEIKNNEEDNQNENENETKNSSEKTQDINPLYNPNKQRYNFKVIILGDIAVGKSSIITRYINNTFSDEYKSSIGCEFRNKQIDIDEETEVILQIWDTVGEERFMSVTRQYYNDSYGAIIAYDITKKESFDKVKTWIKDVKDKTSKDIVIMIVGNKIDLNNERIELGEELDTIKQKYLYCEVSAKNGTNISLAFERLADEIMKSLKEKKEKGKEIVQRDSVPLRKMSHGKKKSKCGC